MTRSKKQTSDLEALEEQIKILKSENRHLKQEIKKESRRYKPEKSSEKHVKEAYEEENMCNECGKGNIIETDLGPRKLIHCTVCSFKRALKK